MARQGRPRMRMLLAARPRMANRILGLMGPRRVERAGRKAAIRAARQAFSTVPFYRKLYEQAGFDQARMRGLTWEQFQQLPTVGKADTGDVPQQELLDSATRLPIDDALISRSSGTTRDPVTLPVGWDEYYVNYAFLKGFAQTLGADRTRTAIVLALPVDGGAFSGNLALRVFFSIKQETRWPFEVCAAGEVADNIISYLRYFAANGFETLYIMTFPGTMERMLDRVQELEAEDPAAGVEWGRFTRKRILLSGQVVSQKLRERVRQQLKIDPQSLESMEVVLGSSDTGQILARTSPFTAWLETYMEAHPEIAEHLGIPEEHRTKPIMEFVPPLAVYMENDPMAGLLLTTWKHMPLIRYRSNDLAWTRPAKELVRALNKSAKGWRKDFARYGYKRRDIPRGIMLGMILGRADDLRFVNGAAVTPDILRNALEAASILPRIHHFKHDSDDQHPNEYHVYLELPDRRDAMARDLLAAEWEPGLLEALISQPAAADLQTAHRATPIVLKLYVRSRGEDEFAGDEQQGKKRFTLKRVPASSTETLPVAEPAHATASKLAGS